MVVIIIIIIIIIEESEGIQHQQMKERLKQQYGRRLRMILKSELNARNKS